MMPRQCPHCQNINPPVASWCYACGESLNPTTNASEEQIQKFISCHGKDLAEYLTNMNKKTGLGYVERG